MEGCKPSLMPLTAGMGLVRTGNEVSSAEQDEMQRMPYRSIIGSLMYAVNGTRGDLSFMVSTLSHYLENPEYHHFVTAKRVLHYLKGTMDLVLMYDTK